MKERTRVETRSNSISSPLQGSQIRLSPAGRPLITTAYRPFGHGPTGSFCKGDDTILAECPSIALALTPSPASPWSYTTVQDRRCDPDVDTNRVSPCSGTSYALHRAKGFRRRQQIECAGRTNPPGTSPRICAYRGQRQRRYDVEGMEGGKTAGSKGRGDPTGMAESNHKGIRVKARN